VTYALAADSFAEVSLASRRDVAVSLLTLRPVRGPESSLKCSCQCSVAGGQFVPGMLHSWLMNPSAEIT